MTNSNSRGRVYLIGAGPGDPRLITLRGVECLRMADVVYYDYLVNPAILEHAPEAETVCLGRHGQGRMMSQEEIQELIIAAAKSEKCVARLKGGDAGIFGHLGEEQEALRRAGVPYEVVPGITAALAAGGYAGIPLTHRDLASAVALVTARERDGKREPALDYEALARFPGTLVFYMGITNVADWSGHLVAAGKPPETPVAIVRYCSTPKQQVYRCRLESAAAEVQRQRIRPPVIFVVGAVAGLEPEADWFTSRPLFGQTVLVTRPADAGSGLRRRLEDEGADVLVQPAIEIQEPESWLAVDNVIDRLEEFDWIVFSSVHGVGYFLDRLWSRGRDGRALARTRLAAIGPATAQALEDRRLRADALPETYDAESLASLLSPDAQGKRFLLIRASRGRDVLAETLRTAGARVTQVVCYRSLDVAAPKDEIKELLLADQITWITVTSSAIARSLVRMFGVELSRAKLASISPITARVLADLGYPSAVVAEEYTMAGLVDAMVSASAGMSADSPNSRRPATS